MTLAAVRAELVDKLESVAGVDRVHRFAPDSVNPPAAFVGTMAFDPRSALGGLDSMTVQVWLVVSVAADSGRGADAIDDKIESVITALEGAPDTWDSLAVTAVEYPLATTFNTGTYMAARFDCEVLL